MRYRILAALLVLAGIFLLISPRAHAQKTAAPTFAPTRFTIVTEGAPAGPAVLLLPGLGSSQAVFDAEAKILAPTYRLYRFQMNGFAGQAAGPNASGPLLQPVVAELHQYLAANHLHPDVIGHSLGGLLALMLAADHPEDVQKLLIVDSLPFYALVFNPAATVAAIEPQAAAMRNEIANAPDDAFSQQASASVGMMVINPEAKKAILAASLASDRSVFADAMYEDLTTDLRPRLSTIKTPTTLIYPFDATAAGPDPAKIDAVYTSAYASMPNLKLHRIENSRHFIMYDQPAAFDAAIQTFLK